MRHTRWVGRIERTGAHGDISETCSGALVGFTLLAAACGRGGDGAEVAGTEVTAAPTTATVAPAPTTAPPTSAPVTYVVQSGDTLSVIATRFGVATQALADFNAIADPNTLQVGQELAIPPAPPPTTAAP